MTLESAVTLFIGLLPYTGFHNKHPLYCTQPMKLDYLEEWEWSYHDGNVTFMTQIASM
jgi:hypothetical protein